jgi:hypothetical protein
LLISCFFSPACAICNVQRLGSCGSDFSLARRRRFPRMMARARADSWFKGRFRNKEIADSQRAAVGGEFEGHEHSFQRQCSHLLFNGHISTATRHRGCRWLASCPRGRRRLCESAPVKFDCTSARSRFQLRIHRDVRFQQARDGTTGFGRVGDFKDLSLIRTGDLCGHVQM